MEKKIEMEKQLVSEETLSLLQELIEFSNKRRADRERLGISNALSDLW